MAINTTDPPANANEYIAHAAHVVGRGKARPNVFDAIYAGKKQVKTVTELMKLTNLSRVRVLQEGGKLAANHIVDQKRIAGETCYAKLRFIQHHKGKIRDLAGNPGKLKSYPTKRSSASQRPGRWIKVDMKLDRAKVRQVTLDDIGSFSAARSVPVQGHLPKSVSEKQFKEGVQRVIGQSGKFKDWGGETNDLFTTRLRIGGKRCPAAFGFKGPGTTGKLTPKKMGKNGDQIQRLFEAPAELFLIQYWREIDQSVLKQMEMLARAKSLFVGGQILYGVIDGEDSNRLYEAYKSRF